jgi:hypothetical protein
MKNNFAQYTSCLDEHMKAHMAEVYMAIWGPFFPQKPNVFYCGKWFMQRLRLGFKSIGGLF